MSRIILGFPDRGDNTDFDFVQSMPSKVGGKPKWLTLSNVPSCEVVICPKCGDMMPLLLQIYAPIDNHDNAYHRMVYVFCCRNGTCHEAQSSVAFKVLRSNTANSDCHGDLNETDPIKMEMSLLENNNVKLCPTCGIRVESTSEFCCKKHEIIHNLVSQTKKSKQKDKVLFSFPLYEIVVEEYDPNKKSKNTQNKYSLEKKLLEEYEKNGPLFDENDDELDKVAQSLAEDKHKYHEKTFEHFRDAMSDYPDQILRYSLNGSQLLASSHPFPTIPSCKNCKAPLQFEFQVMPQLINYLYPENLLSGKSKFKPEDFLEWGTLLIFTCSKSCISDDGSYIEEFIVKQDYD